MLTNIISFQQVDPGPHGKGNWWANDFYFGPVKSGNYVNDQGNLERI